MKLHASEVSSTVRVEVVVGQVPKISHVTPEIERGRFRRKATRVQLGRCRESRNAVAAEEYSAKMQGKREVYE